MGLAWRYSLVRVGFRRMGRESTDLRKEAVRHLALGLTLTCQAHSDKDGDNVPKHNGNDNREFDAL